MATEFCYTQKVFNECKGRYGCKIGEPCYESICDPNGDGIIDMYDLIYISQHLCEENGGPTCMIAFLVPIPLILDLLRQIRAYLPRVIVRNYYRFCSLGNAYKP